MTVIAGTGHRILYQPMTIQKWVENTLLDFDATEVICGMAEGFDILFGLAALQIGIPVRCAVPWRGHAKRPSANYSYILESSIDVEYLSDSEKFPGKHIYQVRNEYMVDECDILIGCFEGRASGTKNCIDYAKKIGCSFFLIHPITLEESHG